MELVIGGSFQGKLEYVRKKLQEEGRVLTPENVLDGGHVLCGEEVLRELPELRDGAVVFNRLHLFVRACMRGCGVQSVRPALETLLRDVPDMIIICDEVGCGIVPVDREERAYREEVGRTLCFLAQRAERVERVIGGLAMRIK